MKKALFVLLVALVVAYAYFVEFKGEERKEKESRIFSIDTSSIVKVKITNSRDANKNTNFILQKMSDNKGEEDAQEQWNLLHFYGYQKKDKKDAQDSIFINDLADTASVSVFLDQLVEQKSDIKLEKDETSQDENRMKKYGLDNPIGSFRVFLEDKTSFVQVGRLEGLNKKTYLMKEDDIWVGDSWWRDQLNQNPNEFRSKNVVNFNNPQRLIIKQRIKQKSDIPPEMQFIKTDTGWILDGKTRDAVDDYLETIKDLEVREFVSRDASTFDDWVLSIVIQEDQLDKFHNLKFVPVEGNDAYVYNSPRDVAIKLSKSSVESLFKDMEALVQDPEDPLKIESDKKDESKSVDQVGKESSKNKKNQEISPSTSQSPKDNG